MIRLSWKRTDYATYVVPVIAILLQFLKKLKTIPIIGGRHGEQAEPGRTHQAWYVPFPRHAGLNSTRPIPSPHHKVQLRKVARGHHLPSPPSSTYTPLYHGGRGHPRDAVSRAPRNRRENPGFGWREAVRRDGGVAGAQVRHRAPERDCKGRLI